MAINFLSPHKVTFALVAAAGSLPPGGRGSAGNAKKGVKRLISENLSKLVTSSAQSNGVL